MASLGDEVGADSDPSGVISRAREVPDVSYRAFLDAFDGPRFYWTAPDGVEIAGVGAAARLTASGPDRFGALRAGADRLFASLDHAGPVPTRPRLFGGLAFHEDHDMLAPWETFPPGQFVLPSVQLVRANGETLVSVAGTGDSDPARIEAEVERVTDRVDDLPAMRPSGSPPGIADQRCTTTRRQWMDGVRDVLERIDDGELRKVVIALACEVSLATDVTVPDVLERLRRTYPGCFRFLVGTRETCFFGAPPERLIRVDDRRLRTEALAGSVARGETPEEDDRLAQSLLDSHKPQHEQQLVVDAICDRLAPLADVRVRDQGIRKLATIQHLETSIEGELADDEHVLTLVEALHPTPAVGGLPPDRALTTIRETETFDRGWYASPVGWFDSNGNGEFAVGIRSAVGGADQLTLFAGNGIVGDSDPAKEWAEAQLKLRPILDELESDHG